MMRFLPVLVGVAAVTASSLDSGRLSGRWSNLEDLPAAGERLNQVKAEIVDWRSEERELDPRQLKVGGVAHSVSRLYVNRKTREQVQMLLICVRPQPISVHEPDVCYAGAGYGRIGELSKITVNEDEFKVGNFAKGGTNPDALRILWGWSTDGHFAAPDNPRRAFGRSSNALFKLYIIRHTGRQEDASTKDPALAFLDVLLPE